MSWKKGFFIFAILGFVSSAASYKTNVIKGLSTTDVRTAKKVIPNPTIIAPSPWYDPEEPAEGIERGVHTVALKPKLQAFAFTKTFGPGDSTPIAVVNVGKEQAEIRFLYWHKFVWVRTHLTQDILPGETKTSPPERPKTRYAFEITNPSSGRVILYTYKFDDKDGYSTIKTDYKEPTYKFDKFLLKVGKQIITQGAGLVPEVGPVLTFLIEVLWPEEQENDPWKERLETVKKMIDDVYYESIIDQLKRTLASYRYDIRYVLKSLHTSEASSSYMALFHKIKSYPDYFACQVSDKHPGSCFPTLPIYTDLINMNLAVYNLGIQYAAKLNLSQDNLSNIIEARKKMVEDATVYIRDQYEQQIEHVYNTCNPDEFYNSIMNVRRFVSLSALEHVTHWRKMVDPHSKIDNNVITYSSFHGISSPALYMQAIMKFGSEPLTPRLVITVKNEVRRVKLEEIQVHYNDNDNICGIMLTFEQEQTRLLGSAANNRSKPLKMRARVIKYLDVDFSSQIDCLKFHMSNDNIVTFGKCSGEGTKRFELVNHYIASLFVANDLPNMNGALANIAVSYQQYPNKK